MLTPNRDNYAIHTTFSTYHILSEIHILVEDQHQIKDHELGFNIVAELRLIHPNCNIDTSSIIPSSEGQPLN